MTTTTSIYQDVISFLQAILSGSSFAVALNLVYACSCMPVHACTLETLRERSSYLSHTYRYIRSAYVRVSVSLCPDVERQMPWKMIRKARGSLSASLRRIIHTYSVWWYEKTETEGTETGRRDEDKRLREKYVQREGRRQSDADAGEVCLR